MDDQYYRKEKKSNNDVDVDRQTDGWKYHISQDVSTILLICMTSNNNNNNIRRKKEKRKQKTTKQLRMNA